MILLVFSQVLRQRLQNQSCIAVAAAVVSAALRCWCVPLQEMLERLNDEIEDSLSSSAGTTKRTFNPTVWNPKTVL